MTDSPIADRLELTGLVPYSYRLTGDPRIPYLLEGAAGPLPAEIRVSLWSSTKEIIQDLEESGLELLAAQLSMLIKLDQEGDLEDEPIDFGSMRYAAALALREDVHLHEAGVVIDRQGQVGFEIDRPNGLFVAIIVQGDGQVVYVLDNRSPELSEESRDKGMGNIDKAAKMIGTFFASEAG